MNSETKKLNSYLTFKLGEELFAANVGKVLNILELTKITEVPKAPEYLKGVINLRGTVLPVIDTKIKFSMGATEFMANTCILVLDIEIENESIQVGALVDSVQEVLEFDDPQIQPPPSIGSKYKSEFIKGMVKYNEDFIMILDMDLVFSTDELTLLKENTSENKTEEASEKKVEEINGSKN